MTAPDLVTECVDRLRPLMDEFGTQAVQRAVQEFVDNDPVEQARIRADVRRTLGMDSCRSILSAELFAELFPEASTTSPMPDDLDELDDAIRHCRRKGRIRSAEMLGATRGYTNRDITMIHARALRGIGHTAPFAQAYTEDTDQLERLAQVIPFPTRRAGGAA